MRYICNRCAYHPGSACPARDSNVRGEDRPAFSENG
jgi:hypothetical protein